MGISLPMRLLHLAVHGKAARKERIYPFHLIIRTPVSTVNNIPFVSHHSFIHYPFDSIPLQYPLRKSWSTHLAGGIDRANPLAFLQSFSHSFMALLSMARLSVMTAALFLPILIQAVAFSVDSFEGIATGKPFDLTWWGDKNVRFIPLHPTYGLTRVTRSQPVTIKLMRGDPEALEPVVVIACEFNIALGAHVEC